MPTTLKFDRLNQIKEYYEPMAISERQKKEREELAEVLFSFFSMLFADMLALQNETDEYNDKLDEIKKDYPNAYALLLASHGFDFDKYKTLPNYALENTQRLIQTTLEHEGINYYYSDERALNVALNESNRVFNDTDLQDAIDSGKTSKTWVTMDDEIVRNAHREMEGVTIDINELFDVDGVYMAYPMDETYNPPADLVVGCRCSLEYGNEILDTDSKPRYNGIQSFSLNGENFSISEDEVMKDVLSSQLGRELHQVVVDNDTNVVIVYGAENPDKYSGKFEPLNNSIVIYGDITKTVEESAVTFIHEATHCMINSPNTRGQELVCYINEHIHRGEPITEELINKLLNYIDEVYNFNS